MQIRNKMKPFIRGGLDRFQGQKSLSPGEEAHLLPVLGHDYQLRSYLVLFLRDALTLALLMN